MEKNLDILIDNLFSGFSEKQAKVLQSRFGIKTGKRKTLQAIGDELNVTRERVRQIEEQGIKKLRNRVCEDAGWVFEIAKKHLSRMGGVRLEDDFLNEVMKETSLISKKYGDKKLFFIFSVAGIPMYHREDDSFHAFWYEDKKAEKNFLDYIRKVTLTLKSADKNEYLAKKRYLEYHSDPISKHFLGIAKHLGTNMFGDFGLKEWPEINPKTIRDKAYLALKKHTKPLHFEDIASKISQLGIDKKKAHVQTVHNELIKDSRFVLVGRGIYALEEHGYKAGTVREVIAHLMNENGPLSAKEVVRLVNKQRFLKENTILLNLQNRKFFKKIDGGKYHIKEA